jgi:hypothetical protein
LVLVRSLALFHPFQQQKNSFLFSGDVQNKNKKRRRQAIFGKKKLNFK